jgi:hypothetical protein
VLPAEQSTRVQAFSYGLQCARRRRNFAGSSDFLQTQAEEFSNARRYSRRQQIPIGIAFEHTRQNLGQAVV